MRLLPALALLLAACQPKADDTAAAAAADVDGDGYPARYDCDDDDADIYPTADERCDGIDNNCDGVVDEPDAVDAIRWYADSDGDDYGNPDVSTLGCAPPPGFIAQGEDCDDRSASTFPGAVEVCNGTDDDCDGTADEDAADAGAWFPDSDGDGYGTGEKPEVEGCRPAAGTYAGQGGDCDDTTAAISPGAAEVCGDGLVNNCDSDEAAARTTCAWPRGLDDGDAVEIKPTGASGSPGWAVAGRGDLTGDGQDDLLIGATGGTDAALILAGPLTDDTDYTHAIPLTGDDAGLSVAIADLDGDGYDDALIGGVGTAWVELGPITSSRSLTGADRLLRGSSGSVLGAAVAAADLDSIGGVELIVGASGSDGVWVLDGDDLGTDDVADVARAFLSAGSGDAGATLAAVGDVNGDGRADLLIGAPTYSSSAGAAWLALGPLADDASLPVDAQAAFRGDTGGTFGDRAGAAVAGLGDIDGDGYDDLAVGAPVDDFFNGRVGAWGGGADADLTTGGTLGSAPLFSIVGGSGELVGGALSTLDDLDGDGRPEVVVGTGYSLATSSDPEVNDGPAEAYLFYSAGLSGSRSPGDADVTFSGPQRAFGLRVQGVGDLNDDGRPDLVITSGQRAEESYLFFTTGY